MVALPYQHCNPAALFKLFFLSHLHTLFQNVYVIVFILIISPDFYILSGILSGVIALKSIFSQPYHIDCEA